MSFHSSGTNDGLSVMSYEGDSEVLLAFDLEESKIDNLAGFSIRCIAPSSNGFPSREYWLRNALNFKQPLTKDTQITAKSYTESNKAPFQVFHWIHFPSAGPGTYKYTVYASYHKNNKIELGPNVSIRADLNYKALPKIEFGFTRGYISSQAYVHKFKNRQIDPRNNQNEPVFYDTSRYEDQYEWLGDHARQMVFDFLKQCKEDPSITVDVFAFDCDEPDIINQLCSMGQRVRMFKDNSKGNSESKGFVKQVNNKLGNARVQLKTGKMFGLAHNKVMIQKKRGVPVKVLTGSANFSVRGLYVQSNSVAIFEDQDIAKLYQKAFDLCFNDFRKFRSSEIASRWYDISIEGSSLKFSFAPHGKAFTLDTVSEAVDKASSSVFFAIMTMTGGGDVFPTIKKLRNKDTILALGTTETVMGLSAFRPNMDNNAEIIPFSYLKEKIPKPFVKEWSGGTGKRIHHKFIVCDFNDQSPVVFCGSSNLAKGGETKNGDNLIAIYDTNIATLYAVEAIRLFDHYRFRNLQKKSTADKPLILKQESEWTKPYYDPKNIKFLERVLLAKNA